MGKGRPHVDILRFFLSPLDVAELMVTNGADAGAVEFSAGWTVFARAAMSTESDLSTVFYLVRAAVQTGYTFEMPNPYKKFVLDRKWKKEEASAL